MDSALAGSLFRSQLALSLLSGTHEKLGDDLVGGREDVWSLALHESVDLESFVSSLLLVAPT